MLIIQRIGFSALAIKAGAFAARHIFLRLLCVSALVCMSVQARADHAPWPTDWSNWNDPELWVTVGNPNNAPDTDVMKDGTTGYGSVEYTFAISKFEVTVAQYLEFLNAKASISDSCRLYQTSASGISRSGEGTVDNPWIYYPSDSGAINRAVDGISFWDAARFCNWLHNGKGNADTENGAYTNIGNNSTFMRLPGARYAIPTENEWYKAAYYTETSISAWYNDFPMRSNAGNWPSNRIYNIDPGNNANFWDEDYGYSTDSAPHITVVGEFENSHSWYGTFDQGGNVIEWTETAKGDERIMRGGAWWQQDAGMQTVYRQSRVPEVGLGFRIASIPEPSSIIPLCVVGLGLFSFVCRRRT